MTLRNITSILSIFLYAQCVPVQTRDHVPLRTFPSAHTLASLRSADLLKVSFRTYHPAVYPLERFTADLMAGQFNDALNSLSLRYTPASGDAKALSLLFEKNFVPVWLDIENMSDQTIDLDSRIRLINGRKSFPSLPADSLPQEFSGLNWNAVALNLVVFTALVLLLAAILYTGNIPGNVGGLGGGHSSPANPQRRSGLSSLEISHAITYDTVLLPMLVPPGKRVYGLVLFKTDTTPEWETLSIRIE